METLSFEFPAGQPPKGRALVGCVGSGDLEVLLEPGTPGTLTIQVQTSVNGAQQRWQHLFERIFQEQTVEEILGAVTTMRSTLTVSASSRFI